MKKIVGVILLSSGILAGCSSGGGGDTGIPTSSAMVTRTIVQLNGDAPATIRTYAITSAQQLADVQARQTGAPPGATVTTGSGENVGSTSSAITVDNPTCAGSDLWMFDQANLTGNELCVKNSGTLTLGNYCAAATYPPYHCIEYWSTSVRSYYPGTENGFFTGFGYSDEHFSGGGGWVNASSSGAAYNSQSITLSN